MDALHIVTLVWWDKHMQLRCTLTLLLTLLAGVSSTGGNNQGPSYKTTNDCVQDGDCETTAGEMCWWYYDGCPRGQCMCDPRDAFLDVSGMCRQRKIGLERCQMMDRCPEGMKCITDICRCDEGRMSSDRKYCLKEKHRLLGDSCNHSHHICLQKAVEGYTQSEVECASYGRCHCKDGYKQDGNICRRWSIREYGCSRDHQCQGGALCLDAACTCPNGYMPVAANSKCAKFGATVELGLGAMCNEIGEQRYCTAHLVCHLCEGHSHHICVHFSDSMDKRFSSSAHNCRQTFALLSISYILSSFLIPQVITSLLPT